MELLSPEKVKNDIEARTAERRARALAASEEEAQINQRLNDARDEEARQKALKELEIKKDITPLEAYLVDLRNEVAELEERKAEAIKPIAEREKEVALRETSCTEKEAELDERERTLKNEQEALAVRADNIQTTEDEIADRNEQSRLREAAVAKSEDENKRNALALGDQWEEFYKMTAQQKEWMAEKEAEVDAGKKANQIKLEGMQLRESDLDKREAALTDKYTTMVMSARQWEKDHPDAPVILEENE